MNFITEISLHTMTTCY